MWKSFIILSINLLVLFQYSEATCGICNTNNGVACVSKTEFQLCFDDKPDPSNTFKCQNPNEICTKFGSICVDTSSVIGAVPACNDISKCGACDEVRDGGFACTSLTTFTMCIGGQLSTTRGTCPQYRICDLEKAKDGKGFCVFDCEIGNTDYCDLNDPIDVPITTTETPATTTTPTTTTLITTTPTTTTPTTTTPTTTTPTTTTPTTTTPTTTTPTTTTPTTTTPTTTTPTTTTPTTTTPTTTPTTTTPTTTTPTTTTPTTTTPTTTTPTTTTPTTTTPTTTTPTTTTPTTTTLPPPTQNPAVVLCSQQTAVGRYPYPNDTVCRSYAFCFMKNNTMQGTAMMCPGDFYFNPLTRNCGPSKPQGCI